MRRAISLGIVVFPLLWSSPGNCFLGGSGTSQLAVLLDSSSRGRRGATHRVPALRAWWRGVNQKEAASRDVDDNDDGNESRDRVGEVPEPRGRGGTPPPPDPRERGIRRRFLAKTGIRRAPPPHRKPKDIEGTPCVCGSGLTYARCCHRLHSGYDDALTATSVLRARFSAYCYRLPLYIVKTTLREGDEWKNDQSSWIDEILDFCDSYRFLGMDLGPERMSGTVVSYLTFTAYLEVRARPVRGEVQEVDFTERSRFVRQGARWYYESGSLLEVTRINKPVKLK